MAEHAKMSKDNQIPFLGNVYYKIKRALTEITGNKLKKKKKSQSKRAWRTALWNQVMAKAEGDKE